MSVIFPGRQDGEKVYTQMDERMVGQPYKLWYEEITGSTSLSLSCIIYLPAGKYVRDAAFGKCVHQERGGVSASRKGKRAGVMEVNMW